MFLESWFASCLITDESAEAFVRYAARDPGKSLRHWRWLAFQDYLEENTPLAGDRCRDLFQLGEAEADLNLGTVMMCAILYQRHCPANLKHAAEQFSRVGVRRAATIMRPASSAATR